jgi:tetratricopeptide (TPR) repeat protein
MKKLIVFKLVTVLLFFILFNFIFSFYAFCVDKPGDIIWEKFYGYEKDEKIYSLIQTLDSGFALAGSTTSKGAGKEDGLIIKLDKQGNKEWQTTYGGKGNDSINSLIQTTNIGYTFAGYTSSKGAGKEDVWIIKIDNRGNTLWEKTFGGKSNDYGYSLIKTTYNGYMVAGYTSSKGAGKEDAWIIKLNNQGTKLWDRTYGGTGYDRFSSIFQTEDGRYVASGCSNSKSRGGHDAWVMKLSGQGYKVWDKLYGGSNDDWAFSIIQNKNKDYVFTGFTDLVKTSYYNFLIVKLNGSGYKIKENNFGGNKDERAYSIIQTQDGGYAIAGWTKSKGAGKSDGWVVKLDSEGRLIWDKTFGGTKNDKLLSIIQTSDGNYVLAGYTESKGLGGTDAWIIKIRGDIQETETTRQTLTTSGTIVFHHLGIIKLTSTPSGASVFLDGTFKGVCPITLNNVTTGKHLIKITKTGYQDYQKEITISSDKTTYINADLSPLTTTKAIDKPGKIFLSSTPSGAKIYLNNLFKGVTPQTLSVLNPGTYQLRLTKSGYKDYQKKITVSSDKTTEVLVELIILPPSSGKIKVTSTPSSAKVFLDAGQYVGKTPVTIDNISPGKHKVTLVLVDYEKYAEEVNVIAGKVIDISTALISIKPKPPSIGKLVLNSTPSSAKVYLNNTYKGITPLTIDQLTPGDYQLKLSKEGYQYWSKQVTIAASQTNKLSVSLIAKPKPALVYGQLSIDSTPSNAKIFLNDKPKGTTPLTLDELSPGTYQLKLTKEGYQDWQQEITIIANQVTRVSTNLKKLAPAYGSIRVISEPEKAEVYLNDILKGNTPLTLDKLNPGTYNLKLTKDGYQDYIQEVKVTTLTADVLSIPLLIVPPKHGQLSVNSTPSAQVYLNNKAKGTTPLTMDNLEPGTYTLKINKEGYQDRKQEINIVAGETTQITAPLSLIPKKEEPAPEEKDTAYQQFFRQGKNYYDGGLYKEAVPLFLKALNIDDTDWQLHYYLGETYQKLEIYNPAIDCYKKAIGLNPQEYEPYFSLGNVYNKVELYKEAIDAYKRAIQINPKPDIFYTSIGIACNNAALPSDAIKYHKKAISINPINTSSYAHLGDIYFDKGLYNLALKSYQQSIRIDAINEETHFKMGQTYYESGNYPEAVNSFKQALRINPTHTWAYHLLGLTYVALGDKASALKQYEILKNLDDSLAKKLKEFIGK